MKKWFATNKKEIIILGIFFIFFMFLIFTFPYSSDDWSKPTLNFIDSIKFALEKYRNFNGRIFGNLLSSWFKHNVIAQLVISSGVLVGIIYIVGQFIRIKKFAKYYFAFLLILLMPLHMFKDVISWQSSFTNFVIPGLATILIIYVSKNLFEDKTEYQTKHIVIAVLCGLFTNFFNECNSVFGVVLGIGLLLISYLLKKKIYKPQVYFLISASIFCLINFLSPVYWTEMPRLANAGEFNSLSIIGKFLNNLKNSCWISSLSYENLLLNIVIGVLFGLNYDKFKSNLDKGILIFFEIIVFIIFPLTYFQVFNILTSMKIQLLFLLLYVLSLVYLIFRLFFKQDYRTFYKLLCLFLSSYIISLPLLFVYIIGPRCFFTAYLLQLLFLATLGSKLYNKSIKFINNLMLVGVIGTSMVFGYTSFKNYLNSLKINSIICDAKENGKLMISLPCYPYPQLIRQKGIPRNEYQYNYYLEHYGLSLETILNFVEYKNFYSNNYAENSFFKGLYIETYEQSNQPNHPSILKIKNSKVKYKYILAYTPLPNNDPKAENPSISVSNSAINWVNIENGINPIVCRSKKNLLDYCSDPYILEKDGKIELWYRFNPYDYQGEVGKKVNSLIYRVTSNDAVNWSDEQMIFDKTKDQAFMSPSILFENGKYRIWYVNYDNNIYYRESKDLKKWSNPRKVNMSNLNGKVWHGEITNYNNRYEYLVYTTDDKLFLTTSSNGLSFEKASEIDTSYLKRKDSRIYKSTYMIKSDKVYLYVPYSYKSDNKNVWNIYLKIYDKKDFYK